MRSRKTWRPQRLDQPPKKSETGTIVEPGFAAGSITLQRGDRLFSLVWTAKDKDRRRALPEGEYSLRTTRLEREQQGKWWFISSSGPAKQTIRVQARPVTKLSIGDVVRFHGTAKRRRGKLQLGFSITGEDVRGLSVYRDGKRVPVSFRVLDRGGKVLAHGPMNYG